MKTKGKTKEKTKEETCYRPRETIAQSKRNHEIKPKKTQQNLQQGGPKTKKAPTSRRDYFKVF